MQSQLVCQLFRVCRGSRGEYKADAAGTADYPGSVQQSETTQQSEESRQTEALPLKNVKKAPKLSGKWVNQNGKVRFLLPDQTYAAETWADIKGKYYYFNKKGSDAGDFSGTAMAGLIILAKTE